MFKLALLIGIYAYLIFGLGLLGILYKVYIISTTLIFGLIFFYIYREKIKKILGRYFAVLRKVHVCKDILRTANLLLITALFVLVLQGIINLVGALGPELGFDALWYHLTLPKIYLQNHSIFYIPGGLLYYSAIPKLTEMLYIAGMTFGSEIFAKLIHYSFGILCLIALYGLSRKFLSKTLSLIVVVLFYSNLVIGWMSITSYVDLARTFFETMALWGLVEWQEKKQTKWLIVSAVMLGLAVSIKLLALESLLIFILLIILKKPKKNIFKDLLIYCGFALAIPLPWLIFSYINTGSPVYPFFSNIYSITLNSHLINPLNLADPISSIYIIFLPVALIFYKKLNPALKIVPLYSFLAVVIWFFTPQTGGGRFILPYLPAFSLITVAIISILKRKILRNSFIGLIIFFALFSLVYRGAANFKYIPVILGNQSKSQFLTNHLNFSFGDFYDTDGYFSKQIKPGDKVLLYGFHNLYYVDFPFIDSSYVKSGDTFNYVAVQEGSLPKKFKNWSLIYYNNKTKVGLYSIEGLKWIY